MEPEIRGIEAKLQRKFHIFSGKKPGDINNPRLLANIREGHYLEGTWNQLKFLSGKEDSEKSRARPATQ
jgi:hypothetical protein